MCHKVCSNIRTSAWSRCVVVIVAAVVVCLLSMKIHVGITHAQQSTPTPTGIPTITWTPTSDATPTPFPTGERHSMRSHVVWYEEKPDFFYGGKSKVWVGSPLLRWPQMSYSGIWLKGRMSVDPTPTGPAKTPTPTSPVNVTVPPTATEPPGTFTPISQTEVNFLPQGLNSSRPESESVRERSLSLLQTTSTPTPLPTSSSPSTNFFEIGFLRHATYGEIPIWEDPMGTERLPCEMLGVYSLNGPATLLTTNVFGGATYEAEIFRTDMDPFLTPGSPPPPPPNPSLPLWTLAIYELLPQNAGRVLVAKKRDLQPNMSVADKLDMGGEVYNQWPKSMGVPPFLQLNDMGHTIFNDNQYLHLNNQDGSTSWEHWKGFKIKKDDPPASDFLLGWDHTEYRGSKAPGWAGSWRHGLLVQGYQGRSFDNTWAPCTCSDEGGRVYCR